MKELWFAVLLWAATIDAGAASEFGRKYVIAHWGTAEGLPQSSVTSLAQTPDGYLWLGTFNGLVRYDGARFKIYNAQNSPGLRGSRIVALYADSRGGLWIGTETAGVHLLRDGEFRYIDLGKQVTDEVIRSITEDPDGRVWLTTTHGELLQVTPSHSTMDPAWGVGNDSANWVACDSDGVLWLGTEKGLLRFDDGHFKRVWTEPMGIHVMTAASAGGIWVATPGRLRRFLGDKIQEDLPLNLPPGTATSAVLEDPNGSGLWIATYGSGLLHWNGSKFDFINSTDGLSHDRLRSLLRDHEGNLWAGTDGGGVNRLRPRLFNIIGREEGLREEVVLSICEGAEPGSVWVGTNGKGLSLVRDGEVRNFGAKEGLSNENVWALAVTTDQRLLAGTWAGGLFTGLDGRFELSGTPGVINGIVCAILPRRNGEIWLGTQHGLVRFEPGTPRIYRKTEGLANEDIKALIEDRQGNLWLGTLGGGLVRFRDDKFETVRGTESWIVWAVHEASDGSLWVGSFGNGLSRVRNGRLEKLSDRFPPSVICKILEDRAGNIWCSSYDGVFRIPRSAWQSETIEQLAYTHFTESDGLPTTECAGGSQSAGVVTSDGRVWFPTVRGVASVDPGVIDAKQPPPRPLIEEVLVDGTNLTQRKDGGGVVVPPGSKRLEVIYTGLTFTKPDAVRFRYRLAGFETDWVEAGDLRFASYTGVPPGDYTFEVAARLSDGTWETNSASLALAFQPFVWQTFWFQGMTVTAIAALIGWLVRLQYQRKLRERLAALEQQNAFERERLRISRDIHDDLGARMTEILLLSDLARRNQSTPDAVTQHTNRISSTARDVVRSLESIVWAINPSNDNLDNFVSYVCQYAERYLNLTDIRCRLEVPADVPHVPISSEVRHNLFLLVKETLNNAVKHSGATEVQISIRAEADKLEVVIGDNGRGFDPEMLERRGNGLGNMERRVMAMGGQFMLETAPGSGTEIRATVPLNLPKSTRGSAFRPVARA